MKCTKRSGYVYILLYIEYYNFNTALFFCFNDSLKWIKSYTVAFNAIITRFIFYINIFFPVADILILKVIVLKLKTWKIISVFGILLISALIHSVYDKFPNFITGLFFPVNESIWEHNKMIFLAFLIWTLVEKWKFKDTKNVFSSGLISSIVCVMVVLLIFTPVYLYILETKDNIVVTIFIYFCAIAISQILSYYLLQKDYNKKIEKLSFVGWVLFFIINVFFTYYPIKCPIFYDYNEMIYGLKKS